MLCSNTNDMLSKVKVDKHEVQLLRNSRLYY